MNALLNVNKQLSEQLMVKQALTATLEAIINKALALNINSQVSLHAVDEKSLTLQLAELGFPLTFNVFEQQILVTSDNKTSDCNICTSVTTLKALQQDQQLTELIKQDKLDIQGDINIAQQFAAIAQHIQIDWQTELAKHIGDFATYKLGRVMNNIAAKLSFFKSQVSADSREYIVHEKKLVLTKAQLEHFYQQVDDVSQQTDKLMERLTLLTAKLNKNQG